MAVPLRTSVLYEEPFKIYEFNMFECKINIFKMV